MAKRQRSTSQPRSERQFLADLIISDQAFGFHFRKEETGRGEVIPVVEMTEYRNVTPQQMVEGFFFPVVAMRMGEKDGGNLPPGCADGRQALRENAGSDSSIDENSVTADLQPAGVPRAAAGQHGESQGHPSLLFLSKSEW